MKQLPEVKRRLGGFLAVSRQFLAKSRHIVIGTALGGMGWLNLPAWSFSSPAPPPPTPRAVAVTIHNRARKAAKLVLSLVSTGQTIPASHRSHSSHSSHASHSSHVSHYSSRSAPSPSPPPEDTPPPATPPHVVAEERSTVNVQSVDRKRRAFGGKDELGSSLEFFYRDDTRIQEADGTSYRLDEYQEKNQEGVPFDVGKKVRVKTASDKKKRIAVKITIIP